MSDHEPSDLQPYLFDLPEPPAPVYPSYEPPEPRGSRAYYDLGGHLHEDMTEAQARILQRQGLGGRQAARIVARADDRNFYDQHVHHPSTDGPREVVLPSQSGILQAGLAKLAIQRAKHKSGGDIRTEAVLLIADMDKRARNK